MGRRIAMAGAEKREILFVVQDLNPRSRRKHELDIAAIRSHAARASKHKKRTTPQRRPARPRPKEVEIDEPVIFTQPDLPIRRLPQLPSISALIAWSPSGGQTIITDAEDGDGERQPNADAGQNPPILSLLGQGRIDPFGVTFAGSLPRFVLKYLDFAYESIWPATIPLTRERLAVLWWRRNPFNEPHAADHHIAAAAALAAKYDADPAIIREAVSIRLAHRRKSIAWINEEVSGARGPPSDRIIMAVLALVVHSGARNVSFYQGYRQSPLLLAHSLHVYGGSDVPLVDQRFLWNLVELKGGINNIESVGVKSALTLTDVITATQNGSHPVLELEVGFEDLAGSSSSTAPVGELSEPLELLGTGFRFVQTGYINQALEACCSLIVDLEHFQQRQSSSPTFGYLAHRRLGVQHALCCLNGNECTALTEESYDNQIRLSALLFSDIVFFVMPPAVGVRSRLLRELQVVLERQMQNPKASLRYDLWLWSLMVGAVGSMHMGDTSSWYIVTLAKHVSTPMVGSNWTRFKGMLGTFLWWDYLLDAPAHDAWTRAQQLLDKLNSGG